MKSISPDSLNEILKHLSYIDLSQLACVSRDNYATVIHQSSNRLKPIYLLTISHHVFYKMGLIQYPYDDISQNKTLFLINNILCQLEQFTLTAAQPFIENKDVDLSDKSNIQTAFVKLMNCVYSEPVLHSEMAIMKQTIDKHFFSKLFDQQHSPLLHYYEANNSRYWFLYSNTTLISKIMH